MDNRLKDKKTISSGLSLVYMLLLGLLASLAALTMRASAGVWSTVPLYPLCVAAACFVPAKTWHRFLFFFGITLFYDHTFVHEDDLICVVGGFKLRKSLARNSGEGCACAVLPV